MLKEYGKGIDIDSGGGAGGAGGAGKTISLGNFCFKEDSVGAGPGAEDAGAAGADPGGEDPGGKIDDIAIMVLRV